MSCQVGTVVIEARGSVEQLQALSNQHHGVRRGQGLARLAQINQVCATEGQRLHADVGYQAGRVAPLSFFEEAVPIVGVLYQGREVGFGFPRPSLKRSRGDSRARRLLLLRLDLLQQFRQVGVGQRLGHGESPFGTLGVYPRFTGVSLFAQGFSKKIQERYLLCRRARHRRRSTVTLGIFSASAHRHWT
jgi:hypothetical protein